MRRTVFTDSSTLPFATHSAWSGGSTENWLPPFASRWSRKFRPLTPSWSSAPFAATPADEATGASSAFFGNSLRPGRARLTTPSPSDSSCSRNSGAWIASAPSAPPTIRDVPPLGTSLAAAGDAAIVTIASAAANAAAPTPHDLLPMDPPDSLGAAAIPPPPAVDAIYAAAAAGVKRRSSRAPALSLRVRLRHRPIVERLVEDRLGDARVARDVAERPPGRGGFLDDLRCAVVADVRVQRRGRGQRQLGVPFALLAVRSDAVDALVRQQARRRRQKPDRLEQVPRHHRDEDVQLEVALHAADGDGVVVPDDLCRDLRHDLRDHGVHLAGHDRAALLQLGQEDLRQTGSRTGAEPADVVRDLRQRHGERPERTGCLDEPVPRRLRLERIGGRRDRQARLRRQARTDAPGELRVRVQARSDRRAAERDLAEPRERVLDPPDSLPHLRGVARELLAQGDRDGVHQVRPARLHHVAELGRLPLE